jgi:hypothetical protein
MANGNGIWLWRGMLDKKGVVHGFSLRRIGNLSLCGRWAVVIKMSHYRTFNMGGPYVDALNVPGN